MLRILASFIIGMAFMPLTQAKVINDTEIADNIQVAEETLSLNGAGIQ